MTSSAKASVPSAAAPHALHDRLTASADAQLSSPFFTKLPLEVRKMIYIEFWRTSGLRQHITELRTRETARLVHSPCITDTAAPDERYARYQSCKSGARPGDGDGDMVGAMKWHRRLKSDWTVHWECGELAQLVEYKPAEAPWSPFLRVLLTCRRFYLEGLPSIFESVTFCLTDILLANKFLSRWPANTVRSVDLSLLMTASLTDFYLSPGKDKAIIVGQSTFTDRNNWWEKLCETLARLAHLRNLHVWLDSKDLRPWHKSVAETRLFGRLLDVRAANLTLSLPELPKNPEARGLPGYYLDDLEDASVTVVRSSRPNKWSVHLSTRAGTLGTALHEEVPVRPAPAHWQL